MFFIANFGIALFYIIINDKVIIIFSHFAVGILFTKRAKKGEMEKNKKKTWFYNLVHSELKQGLNATLEKEHVAVVRSKPSE